MENIYRVALQLITFTGAVIFFLLAAWHVNGPKPVYGEKVYDEESYKYLEGEMIRVGKNQYKIFWYMLVAASLGMLAMWATVS